MICISLVHVIVNLYIYLPTLMYELAYIYRNEDCWRFDVCDAFMIR